MSDNYPTREGVMRSKYLAGRVERYHTWPTIHRETVAEHTFGVLMIYRDVFGINGNSSVVRYIMDHDLPELHVGDVPFPAKRRYKALGEAMHNAEEDARAKMSLPQERDYGLKKDDVARVKVCDLLQMWQFGRAEMKMGNTFAMAIVTDTSNAAVKLAQERLPKNEWTMVDSWMKRESEL